MAVESNDRNLSEPPRGPAELIPFTPRPKPPQREHKPSHDDPEHTPENEWSPWIGLGIAAVLVVVGFLLTVALQRQGRIEDCLMAGRRNCDALLK